MNTFNEEDKNKFIQFLNLIAVKGEFNLKTAEVITFFKLLQHMQTVVLPKINDNILEIVAVHEGNEDVSTD